ncbi:MAG: alpha/beta hydrolase family protein [Pseudomonadota bacterium]
MRNQKGKMLRARVLLACVLAGVVAAARAAPDAPGVFREPAPAVTRLLTALPPPKPLVHARSGQVALLQYEQLISQARLTAPRLGLAGFRLDPVTLTTGIEPRILQVEILSTSAEKQTPRLWQAGGESRFEHVQFAPDGRTLAALRVQTGQPSRLVLYDIATGSERSIDAGVNPAWGNPCAWVGNDRLLCRMVPAGHKPPAAPALAPLVMSHAGAPTPVRTYDNLLESPADDDRFDQYFTTELALITRDGREQRLAVAPGPIRSFLPSPDGSLVILRRLERPYSRLVPASGFPARIEAWNLQTGQRIYQSALMGFGIEEEDGEGADAETLVWAPLLPLTAGFLFQQQEGGKLRYQWRSVQAPFKGENTKVVAASDFPIRRFGWTSAGTPWYACDTAVRGELEVRVVLADGSARGLWRGTAADRYGSPGRAIRLDGSTGPVLESSGEIFLEGDGLAATGPQPFLDALNLQTGATRRLFLARAGEFDEVLAVLDATGSRLLTSRESETSPPTLYLVENGKARLLRQQPDPYPELQAVERRLITYPRADGVKLAGTLYLPKQRAKNKPLPTLIWIYPYEYNDPQQAEQLDERQFRFHRIKGPAAIAAAVAGYAVLVNPTVPIIQEGSEPADEYLPQLVASVEAAVDYLAKEGISDPNRMAVGGRSYGAFSSANLLIHSQRFATAIAMSGAYNRTLTPFGFQHEKRTFWDATEYYTSISPFFHANRIKVPLLLVHGGSDPNPGTPTLQARRFFHALAGEGATVRYVELPFEEHHYKGRETVLHAAWEMIDWLDTTIGPAVPR